MKIDVEKKILSENDRIAAENRRRFKADGVFVVNIMSSPGSGKTSLLERTIPALTECTHGVIEGDIETDKDAQRLTRLTSNVVQINTHGACHLSAARVAKAYDELRGPRPHLVFIENIGNLVCPANYDLGEDVRAVMVSVTEGDDKPAKYPGIFVGADAVLVNKMDLMAHLDCSITAIREALLAMNARAKIFEVSCRTGEGLAAWFDWLKEALAAKGGRGT
jgi:hydrogenase nickel incorporation protein HypB